MNIWLGNVDEVISYVRDEQRNAESYGATLDGKLRSLLEMAANEQTLLLQEEPVRATSSRRTGRSTRGGPHTAHADTVSMAPSAG
ncbi:hypothetical protein [Sorangium sp. So ce1000]|uniref:hypothetical protein n=1 Tax=Sorangium sp. So ce1000 TaxID=3133325 RepID=UPI003F5E5BA1